MDWRAPPRETLARGVAFLRFAREAVNEPFVEGILWRFACLPWRSRGLRRLHGTLFAYFEPTGPGRIPHPPREPGDFCRGLHANIGVARGLASLADGQEPQDCHPSNLSTRVRNRRPGILLAAIGYVVSS